MSCFSVKVSDWGNRILSFKKEGPNQFEVIKNVIDTGIEGYPNVGVLYDVDVNSVRLYFRETTCTFSIDNLGEISVNDEILEHAKAKDTALMVINSIAQKVAEAHVRDQISS